MRAVYWIRALLRTVFRSSQLDADLDEEIRAAHSELAARHAARGLTDAQARRRAALDLGGLPQLRERSRDVRPGVLLETFWTDLRQAARTIRRAPSFSFAVVATFALGIGANVAIFTAVKAVLIEPLPYRDANRLAIVWADLTSAGYPRAPLAAPELKDLRDRSTRFEALGAIWANTAALTGPEPEQLRIGLVTTNFFDVLGVAPAAGRTFLPADETGPPSILLSWELFQRRYGANPSLVGKTIEVNGAPSIVVGVMKPDFRIWLPQDAGIPDGLQAWRPFGRGIFKLSRGQQFLRVIGRLKPGATVQQASDDVAAVGREVTREFHDYARAPLTLSAVGLQADVVRDTRPALLALFGAVALLLCLACVNVANLFVSRTAARRQELALRAALGASRMRLFRHAVAEGVVLSILGGAAGVAVAWWALGLVIAIRPEGMARLASPRLDFEVLLFAAATAIACGVLVALGATLHIVRADAAGVLRRMMPAGWQRVTGAAAEHRVRTTLVGVQIAVTLVLLVCAGLLAQTLMRLQKTNLGFDARGTLTFRIAPAGPRYRTPDVFNAFARDLRSRLRQMSGVESVGMVSHVPFDQLPNWSTPYTREEEGALATPREADARAISPGYLETVGADLVAGRDFTDEDATGRPRVAIVDQRFAEQLWPGLDPIGKRVKADPLASGTADAAVEIVGVVRHMRHRTPSAEVRPQIYFSNAQVLRTPIAVIVRAHDAIALSDAAIAAVHAIDPQLPVYDVRPFDDYARRAFGVPRFTSALAVAFSVVAFAVAIVGVYGVLAYSVARRRQEFAVRVALGADRRTVLTAMLRETMRFAAPAMLIGSLAAYAAATALAPQLYAITPADPFTYIAALTITGLAIVTAAVVPTARTAGGNLFDALRDN
jgi:putative ABC transport system permease protein